MKLNYRDRIILLVIIAIVILVGGFVGLIKPRYEDITESKSELAAAEEEWNGLDAKIQQIPVLKTNINEIYDESLKLSEIFYVSGDEEGGTKAMPEHTPQGLDMLMQDIVDENNLSILNLEVGLASSGALEYYYYSPVVPTAAILDLADINGNYTAEINEKLAESNALSERVAENALSQQYGIRFTASQEDLWNFMTAIDELDKSMFIESVNISDASFGYEQNGTSVTLKEDAKTNSEGIGVSEVTVVINVYSAYELDKPIFE